ncbi:hypothetical protein RGQ15_10380 [Paracoccus sp. MBLB3053]|uniref:Uncharacterized protein n=1 Tax=Paracoccus aurantius TaxID=3073814 RepID=A0ABU2HSH0_9RHOB|nr:hypothetical protein [Paracoccus sp. MBLB3053]MDS9467971.1 hypothetical protein [Paracoccus sp. MBLB3053]
MAFSRPRIYLEQLARPMCNRFAAEPTSYDLAIASCNIIYHFADVLAYTRNLQPHVAAQIIAERIPKFETIQALANAGKHVELRRHRNHALNGLKAEDLVRGNAAAFSDGSYFSDGSTFSDMPETVVVTTPDGRLHDVLHTCMEVLVALEESDDFLRV